MKGNEQLFYVADSSIYTVGGVVRDTNGRIGEIIAIVSENYIRVRWNMNTTIKG
jgi:hypothetical protein